VGECNVGVSLLGWRGMALLAHSFAGGGTHHALGTIGRTEGAAMNAKESSAAWRALARAYHAHGLNIVPLGADKRPMIIGVKKTGAPLRFFWEDWQDTPQNDKLFDKMLEPTWWAEVRGIAAICGPISNNLICFDFDHCPVTVLQQFLERMKLPADYPWAVATPGGGFHLWVRVATALQIEKGKQRRAVDGIDGAFVELRWTGHYTALPGSVHPSGGIYSWLHDEPKEPPWTL
jgi:hypothetical protein